MSVTVVGTENCKASRTGLFCDASKSSCSAIAGPHIIVYPIVTSGKCTDRPRYLWIIDKATCETAAQEVGWSDTGASVFSDSYYPRGCFDMSSSSNGGDLYFQHTNDLGLIVRLQQAWLLRDASGACVPHTDGITPKLQGDAYCGQESARRVRDFGVGGRR